MKLYLSRILSPLCALGVLASASATAVHAADYIYVPQRDVTVIQTDPQVIDHFDNVEETYTCPDGASMSVFDSDQRSFTNLSSPGVTEAWEGGGGEGASSLTVLFTNGNPDGGQTFQTAYVCHGQHPAPVTQPTTSQQPQNTNDAAPKIGLEPIQFKFWYNNLLSNLPLSTRRSAPSGYTLATDSGPTTLPNGSQLVRLFASPQLVTAGGSTALGASCPLGGHIVADPTLRRSVLPFVPRVSNPNMNISLFSGDVGSTSLQVAFTNDVQTDEVVSFRFACIVPN